MNQTNRRLLAAATLACTALSPSLPAQAETNAAPRPDQTGDTTEPVSTERARQAGIFTIYVENDYFGGAV